MNGRARRFRCGFLLFGGGSGCGLFGDLFLDGSRSGRGLLNNWSGFLDSRFFDGSGLGGSGFASDCGGNIDAYRELRTVRRCVVRGSGLGRSLYGRDGFLCGLFLDSGCGLLDRHFRDGLGCGFFDGNGLLLNRGNLLHDGGLLLPGGNGFLDDGFRGCGLCLLGDGANLALDHIEKTAYGRIGIVVFDLAFQKLDFVVIIEKIHHNSSSERQINDYNIIPREIYQHRLKNRSTNLC